MEAMADEPAQGPGSRLVYAAFVALAVLAGPVSGYASGAFLYAVSMQVFAGQALCAAVAGAALLGLGIARQEKRMDSRQWMALLLLLIPQWCSIPIGMLGGEVRWLHGVGWGTALLLSVAAPLWLGLIAALDLAQVKVPRVVAGAAIAGVFAVCLVVPVQAYRVAENQAAMLVLQLLLNIAMVLTWAYAAPRLAGVSVLQAAGSYLLLSAGGNAAFAISLQRGAWQPLDWASAWAPVLLQTAVMACVWLLWFWLLQRMALAAFCTRALAAWAAAVTPGFVMGGFTQWRVDLALAIAVGAIVVALRARVADEQPLALGLGGT